MASDADFKVAMWVVGMIVVFWLIAIPAIALSKPLGGR